MSPHPDETPADTWLAALDGPEVEHKVKGSRFLGQVFAARSEVAARAALLSVRKRHHAATHHVYAWSLPPASLPVEKADDDGEPSQTAGAPVLQAIHSTGRCGLIVVVTRYFGGTKLGTGGLIKAYGEAARLALDAAPVETIWIESIIELLAPWEDVGTVEAFLARHESELRGVERDFGNTAVFRLTVARSLTKSLIDGIREASAARVTAKVEEPGTPPS